jgi:radical SAM superfamily enzyme YgiQ (UPF0313 family)
MRVGLIAMSGVRVCDAELMKLGLTLPGFVERSEVIASLPSLSLLTLAALTPPDVEVSYHEIAEMNQALPTGGFDLVAISTMTAQAFEAYAVADGFRAAGVKVVMGGLHATCVPDQCAEHADAVVVGAGEPVWAGLIEDARAGGLQRFYRSETPFDLKDAPLPRFELLDPNRYNRLTVQTARGCPHKCGFCASSILIHPGYSVKPVAKIMEEVRAIKKIWARPFIEFADDNSFLHRGHARELMSALEPERVKWFTECDISIAEDTELLDAMRRAGCRQVLIGLESPTADGLDTVDPRRWKLRQIGGYEAGVRRIQSRGITVIGCFVLGLDGQGPGSFAAVEEFANRVGLYDVQVTVQTPFPGTPLYRRLEAEGRLTHPGRWDRCTLFDVNYRPEGMSVEELERDFRSLVTRLYRPEAVRARRAGFGRLRGAG